MVEASAYGTGPIMVPDTKEASANAEEAATVTATAAASADAAPAASAAMVTASSPADELIKLSSGKRPASTINVAVYGGGSFGTAMAAVLGRKGVKATLVVRRPDVVDQINDNHVNPYYQSDLLLPEQVCHHGQPQPSPSPLTCSRLDPHCQSL